MKVKLTDQLHLSELGADTLPGGSIVDVSDSTAADLVRRGLATKAAPSPANKMKAAPKNKSARPRIIGSGRR